AATTLPLNGSTQLIAQVLEASGTPPHSGTHVSFTTTLGTIQPSEAETDIAGRVFATFFAGNTSGTATISAISGAATSTTTSGSTTSATTTVVKILVGAAAVDNLTLTASATSVPPNGGTV